MLDKQLDEVVTALTLEQKENCLQMVMLWQSRHRYAHQ